LRQLEQTYAQIISRGVTIQIPLLRRGIENKS
jgi:hypothetical protein